MHWMIKVVLIFLVLINNRILVFLILFFLWSLHPFLACLYFFIKPHNHTVTLKIHKSHIDYKVQEDKGRPKECTRQEDVRGEEEKMTREGETVNLSSFLLGYYSQLINDVALTHNITTLIIQLILLMKLGSLVNHESKAKTHRGGKGVETIDVFIN